MKLKIINIGMVLNVNDRRDQEIIKNNISSDLKNEAATFNKEERTITFHYLSLEKVLKVLSEHESKIGGVIIAMK